MTTGLSYAVLFLTAVWAGCGSAAPLKSEAGAGGSGGVTGATAMASADGATLTCGDLLAAIKTKLNHAVMSADRTCKTDADCTSVGIGNFCYGDPCSPLFVSRPGAAVINAELAEIEVHDCEAVERAGCASRGTGPYGSCPSKGVPLCVGGLCRVGLSVGPGPEADAGADGPRCCPRDPMNSGCMDLGGLAQAGCHQVCDFWCSINWRVELDAQGCEVWRMDYRSPAPGETRECLPARDGGADADAPPGS